jgi:hybrid cluster-associated redox disulfide protein
MAGPILGDQLVASVLEEWPQIIPYFLQKRLYCVGCSMSAFETLAEVSAIYHLDLREFLFDLNQVIQDNVSTLKLRSET